MAALCVANLAGGMVYFFCQVIQILMYAYGQNERIFFYLQRNESSLEYVYLILIICPHVDRLQLSRT